MKCPKCNKELEVLDMYDVEHGSDFCVEYLVGQCPECKKSLSGKLGLNFIAKEI